MVARKLPHRERPAAIDQTAYLTEHNLLSADEVAALAADDARMQRIADRSPWAKRALELEQQHTTSATTAD